MGSRGAGSGRDTAADNKIFSQLDKIRNSRHENLMIFDNKGNVVYQEGGSLNHTGYGDAGQHYEGNTAAHNHPKGVEPYPSDTDFDTFQRENIKQMVLVSPDYTVTVKADPNFKSLSGIRPSITYTMHNMQAKAKIASEKKAALSDYKKGVISKQEYYKRYRNATFKAQQDACKRAGYIMTVTENKKKK